MIFNLIKNRFIMWREKNNALHAEFKFPDFSSAIAFIVEVSMIAEKMNHHPTWTNTWNKVDFILSTHDAGNKVTDKDHALALKIEGVATKYLA